MKFWDVRELNINELRRVVIRYCLPLSAKHDHYLLKEVHLPKDATLAMDRGYVDIAQVQRLTEEGVFAIHEGTVIFCYWRINMGKYESFFYICNAGIPLL